MKYFDQYCTREDAFAHVLFYFWKSFDPRAHEVLGELALADPRWWFQYLQRMVAAPRPKYLGFALALLSDPRSAPPSPLGTPEVFTKVGLPDVPLGVPARAWAVALIYQAERLAEGGDEHPVLRSVATDRTLPLPEPPPGAAEGACAPAALVAVSVYRLLCSPRLLALRMLDDRELLATVAGDSSEPDIVRYWATQWRNEDLARTNPRAPAASAAARRDAPSEAMACWPPAE
ncbi:MAG: hypothetical protein IT373_15050 [Polyangiaceae bacterium]|nr:hypothetical protein [Polyangiaceae bacterium]